ncbi:MAG: peptidoglycan DD-metalloendopeptidase family protein [bacterium]
MSNFFKKSIVFIFVSALLVNNISYVVAADIAQLSSASLEELQKRIDEKGTELQKIQAQREILNNTLEEISKSGNSIKKDIQTYNTSINELNLSIKANSVNVNKLELEINSLSGQIGGIGSSISIRKQAIANLLTELQQKESEDLFTRILKGNSLSESIAEVQSITTLNTALSTNITELKNLREDYTNKIDENKQKKVTKQAQTSNLVNLQIIVNEQKNEKQKILEQTKSQEQFYAQQIEELDKKQAEISAVIDDAEYKLRSTFDPTLLPLKRTGVLGFPAEEPYITQCYGPTKFAARAYRSKMHNGVDFGGAIGTPILAAESGTILKVGNNDRGTSRWNKFQYGKYIIIKHNNNLATLYAHLSRVIVKEGQVVNRGDVIGYSGNTGYTFGPHLHFTVFWAPSIQFKSVPPAAGVVPIGITVNPIDYIPDISNVSHSSDSSCK